MVRVETEVPEAERKFSRSKLLKRAAVGGGAVYAAGFMTSAAYAGQGGVHCNPSPQACDANNPCFGQTTCSGDIPPGSLCACVPHAQGNGQGCFCHEAQFCAGLTPCENNGDCPPSWKCALSCCGGQLCLPPCGTNPVFASLASLKAAAGQTTVG
jgi:hypothetical protein